MTKTARLYGGSLYTLAAEESLTDEILTQMQEVQTLFHENEDWLRLLTEPAVPKTERIAMLDEAFGGQMQLYLLNFLKILCENGLLREFSGCLKAFQNRYNEDHGIEEATAVTAVPLTDAEAAALRAKLEKVSGKTIILKQRVDADVLGGVRVEFADHELDGTAKARLSGIRRAIGN